MATINFPSSPTTGQTYTFEGRVWEYDGTGWQVQQTNISYSTVVNGLGYIPFNVEGGTISGNLVLQGTLVANGTEGLNGQALLSNGSGIYWASSVAAASAGSNQNVQFNNSGTTSGTNGFNFNASTNTITVSNTVSVGSTINLNSGVFGNSSGLYPASNTVGINLGSASRRWILSANSIDSNSFTVDNSTSFTANSSGVFHSTLMDTLTMNAASHTVGSSFEANSTGVYHTGLVNAVSITTTGVTTNTTGVYPSSNTVGSSLGNTAQRWVLSAISGDFSTTVNAVSSVNSSVLSVGTSFIANTTGAYHTGTMNAASFTTTGTTANVLGVYPSTNSSGFNLGSATQRWVIIANSGTFSTTVNAVTSVNSALLTVGTSFIANTIGAYHTGTMNAASFTTTGVRANTLGVYPTSNTSGQNLGNTISRWAMFGLTLDVATTALISGNTQISSLGVGTAASGTAGEIRATNNITAFFASDKRLKKNVKKIEQALDKLDKISGVEFDWIDEYIKQRGGEDGYFVRKHDVGVIAQELEQILPEAVATRQDGYKAVAYEKIVSILIEAIKELRQEVKELKNK